MQRGSSQISAKRNLAPPGDAAVARRYRTYLEQLGISYPTVRAPEPQQD
jgi:hypothetical protein